jgi:glycosyltransferase involved in cell wall biosynthesis
MSEKKIERALEDVSKNELLASVIIPVFNKEDFIETCIASLDSQNLNHTLFEAIFINDGSIDGSLRRIEEACRTRNWIKIIDQSNQGVQEARNAGINAAAGKYLFFLDPDDTISANAIKDVSAFFDNHYNDVDLVTYQIVPMTNGKPGKLHYRYKTLTTSGIYDLNDRNSQFICQTTMNICVKNRGKQNQLFDFEAPNGVVFHEDEFYIAKILSVKMKIGYVSSAQYYWIKNPQSVTSSALRSYYIFDNSVHAYEKLFESFKGPVPFYFQGMLVNDLGWKMRSNCALPNHLRGKARERAMERLSLLLDNVEDEVILRNPNMNLYHGLYFIDIKNRSKLNVEVGFCGSLLTNNEKLIAFSEKIELYLLKTRISDKHIELEGFAKSPIFKFIDNSQVRFAFQHKTASGDISVTPIEPSVSSWSAIACKSTTATFYSIKYSSDIKPGDTISFVCLINGIEMATFITSDTPFSNFVDKNNYVVLRNKISLALNRFQSQIKISNSPSYKKLHNRKISSYRKIISMVSNYAATHNHPIWVYCDSPGKTDNAWFQFQHDAQINDGVLRFYIANKVKVNLAKSSKNAHIVSFASKKHQILYYSADKILCSDIEPNCWRPRKAATDKNYRDLFHAELIYLQHGVLWAHMPWYYSKDRMRFDRQVISTTLEKKTLTTFYGFNGEDLIESGMPRYAAINPDVIPSKKILLCPSWRSYLVGPIRDGKRQPLEKKFIESTFYRELIDFINDPSLTAFLEKEGLTIDVQIHPNFSCYKPFFKSNNDLIKVVSNAKPEDYAIAITDYSSFSFDFLYLKRPIIYFIPDYELFQAGLNHYKDLDVPIDDAFGEFTKNSTETIKAIKNIIENNSKPLEKYSERIDNLFLHRDGKSCDRIYGTLSHN